MITKEIWLSYSKEKKKEEISNCLQQLYDIDHSKHDLSGKKEQGVLAKIKKDLETFILNTLEWEKVK